MGDAWRLARSLDVLRDEIRSRWPGTTFWTIGDADHRDSWSAHNPNAAGVVCAADILGDGGMPLAWFAEHIRTCGHRDLDYVIYQDRIASAGGPWRDYGGAYHSHVHVAVGNGPDGRSTRDYDHTDPWGVAAGHGSAPTSGAPPPTLRENDSGPRVGQLQAALNDAIAAGLVVDGDYGPATAAAVAELQRRSGITVDEIYGPDSAGALRDLLEEAMPSLDDIAFAVWSYTNEKLTDEDAYQHLRHPHLVKQVIAEQKAAKARDEAILGAVQGLDGEAIMARIDQRAAEDAERDAAAAAERSDIMALIEAAQSGELAADAVVDQIAARLGGGS